MRLFRRLPILSALQKVVEVAQSRHSIILLHKAIPKYHIRHSLSLFWPMDSRSALLLLQTHPTALCKCFDYFTGHKYLQVDGAKLPFDHRNNHRALFQETKKSPRFLEDRSTPTVTRNLRSGGTRKINGSRHYHV